MKEASSAKPATMSDEARSESHGPALQLRREIAGLSYEEQMERVRPSDTPGSVQQKDESPSDRVKPPVQFAKKKSGGGKKKKGGSKSKSSKTKSGGKKAKDEKKELTPAECKKYARAIEVKFAPTTAGKAMPGAQALVDAAITMVELHVEQWNKRVTEVKKVDSETDAKMKVVEKEIESSMGTKPLDRKGKSNQSIAGAVPPSKVRDHLKTGTGTVRTKMTAVYNFISYLSKAVLAEHRSGDDTFFTTQGKHGETLKQAAIQAEINIKKQIEENKKLPEKDQKYVRQSILGKAASPDTRAQNDTRGDKPGNNDKTKVGQESDGFRSKRKGNHKSLGEKITKDEKVFMGIKNLAKRHLTWREGLDLYYMKEENSWVKKMKGLGMPIGAGPSGTTDRIMQTGGHLKCDPKATRAASIGYLLPINAHTLVEIMTSAKPYGPFSEPVDSFAMYKKIPPFGSLKAFDKSPGQIFWNDKVEKA